MATRKMCIFGTGKTRTVKTAVIEFFAPAKDGLNDANPHIVFDAIPKLGKVYSYCSGYIEIPASRTEKVIAMMSEAGFEPKIAEGRIVNNNYGSFFIED